MRVFKLGAAPPPLVPRQMSRDLAVHHFTRRPQPSVAGALEYSYDSAFLQQQSLVGAGTGLARQGLRAYTKPMVALPTVTLSGMPYMAGQIFNTPLSPPVEPVK